MDKIEEKCPKCGLMVHPDDIRRGKIFRNMRYPCGSYVNYEVMIVDGKPESKGFHQSLKCLYNQIDVLQMEIKNLKKELTEVKGVNKNHVRSKGKSTWPNIKERKNG